MITHIFGKPVSQHFPIRSGGIPPRWKDWWHSASTCQDHRPPAKRLSFEAPEFLQELQVIRVADMCFFWGEVTTYCGIYHKLYWLSWTVLLTLQRSNISLPFPAWEKETIGGFFLFRRRVRGFHHLDLQLLTIFQLKSCPMYLGWWRTAYFTNLQCQ